MDHLDHYLYRLVGSLGTLVTSFFVIDFDNHSMFLNSFLIFTVGYSCIFLALDGVRSFRQRPLSFDRTTDKGKNKIASYLVAQLKSSGSVVIFSKDLTWVKKDSEAEKLLVTKAKAGELTLFVEGEFNTARTLKAFGADVHIYADQKKKGFSPKSRFTILDHRAGQTRVMVGVPANNKHYIKHYGDEGSEIVDLANDFVSLLTCTAKTLK